MLKPLIAKEYGYYSRPTHHTVDGLLSKLTCHQDDEYPGILSMAATAPSSDLVYACKFSPLAGFQHILALANEEGKMALQNTNLVGKSRPLHGYQAHDNAVFDICWSPHATQIVTASGDQTAVLWDIGAASVNPVSIFRGHTASLKTVDFSPCNPSVFSSGSRDGSVMVWDSRNHVTHPKPENTIRNAHALHCLAENKSSRSKKKLTPSAGTINSITAVLFQDEHTLISSGASDGYINVWDLRKNYTVYKGDPVTRTRIHYGSFSNRSGATSLCLNPTRTLLYAATMDDVIYEFNVASYDDDPVAVYGGHEQHSFYIKACLSGDGAYLLSGSSDDHAYIWRVGAGPEPMLKLEGHGAEVTCVAWCSNDITKLVTCADDVRHRVWRLNPAKGTEFEEQLQIKGRAVSVDTGALPASFQDVQNRLEKKRKSATCSTAMNHDDRSSCLRTPSSLHKFAPRTALRTPELGAAVQQRSVLSPLACNATPSPLEAGACRGASRRLEMESFPSPTSGLPNSVLDGTSPHHVAVDSAARSSSKRKRLDWLTDLSRKLTPKRIK